MSARPSTTCTDLIGVANIAHNMKETRKEKVEPLCGTQAWLQCARLKNKAKVFKRMRIERERILPGFLLYNGEQKDCTTKIWGVGEHLSLRCLVCTQKNLSIALHNLCLFAKDTHTTQKPSDKKKVHDLGIQTHK